MAGELTLPGDQRGTEQVSWGIFRIIARLFAFFFFLTSRRVAKGGRESRLSGQSMQRHWGRKTAMFLATAARTVTVEPRMRRGVCVRVPILECPWSEWEVGTSRLSEREGTFLELCILVTRSSRLSFFLESCFAP